MIQFIDFAAVEDLAIGTQLSLQHGFRRILLCRTDDGIFAVADLCPHALQPLLGAEISGGVIRCPKHGAMFAVATGRPQNSVTNKPLQSFPVRVQNGRIEIAV